MKFPPLGAFYLSLSLSKKRINYKTVNAPQLAHLNEHVPISQKTDNNFDSTENLLKICSKKEHNIAVLAPLQFSFEAINGRLTRKTPYLNWSTSLSELRTITMQQRNYFQLLSPSQETTTAGSSTCLIWQSFDGGCEPQRD